MHLQFLSVFIDDFMEHIPSLRPVESFDPFNSRHSVVILTIIVVLTIILLERSFTFFSPVIKFI